MKRALALILAAMMLVAALAACGDKEKPTTSDPGTTTPTTPGTSTPGTTDPGTSEPTVQPPHGTFTTYTTTFATTVSTLHDTTTQVSDASGLINGVLYNDAVTEDRNHWEWVLEYAADWPQQVDTEGKVWRIPVKQGYKWSNGDPITAHDWEYTGKLTLDPKLLSLDASGWINCAFFKVKNCDKYFAGECTWDEVGWHAIDDYTLEVTGEYAVKQSSVYRFCSKKPYNEKFVAPLISADGTSTTFGTSIETSISSGAFILTEWVPDAQFTFVRNPDFVRADEIHMEKWVTKYVPDSQTAIELFLQGGLSQCSISYTDWPNFEDDPRTWEYFNDSLMYMFVNTGNPNQNNLLGNLNFRKAMYFASDRQSIADTLDVYPAMRFVRKAVVGNMITGEAFTDLPQDYVLSVEESFDPAKAKQFYAKALEECKLTSATIEILHSETATHIKAVSEILQTMWPQNLGNSLTVTIRQVPSAQATTLRRFNPDDPTAFDTALGSLLPSSTDARDGFKFFLTSYSPPRFAWHSEEFDKVYEESQKYDLYTEPEKIIEYSMKMEKMLLDDLVIVPIYERPEKTLVAENVHLPVDKYIVGFGMGYKYATIDD